MCDKDPGPSVWKLAGSAAQYAGIAEEALNLVDGLLTKDLEGGYTKKAVRDRAKELRRKLMDLP